MPRKRYVPPTRRQEFTTPFVTAEEAWFWFIRCQRARQDGARFEWGASEIIRPCDPDDLYRAVMGLARRRMIGREHLWVLEKYGLRERPPDTRITAEQRSCRLWKEAFDRLGPVLEEKQIVG